MEMRFAYAVDNNGEFKDDFFGHADRFLIYKYDDGKLQYEAEEKNTFKSMGFGDGSSSPEKSEAIIDLLKNKNVHALVARKFGKNITRINNHFIPVVIHSDDLDDASQILLQHIEWITDEWHKKKGEHKMFMIKNGILKLDVKSVFLQAEKESEKLFREP